MMPAKQVDPVEKIKIWWEVFQDGIRNSVEAALGIGEILCQQKTTLPHGDFLPWLRENVTFISESTCQRWMRLHRNRALLKSVSVTDLTGAYKLLMTASDEGEKMENEDTIVGDDLVEEGAVVVGEDHDEGEEPALDLRDDDEDDQEQEAEGASEMVQPVLCTRRSKRKSGSEAARFYEDVDLACRKMEEVAGKLRYFRLRTGRIRRAFERGIFTDQLRSLHEVVTATLLNAAELPCKRNFAHMGDIMKLLEIEVAILTRDFPVDGVPEIEIAELTERVTSLRDYLDAMIERIGRTERLTGQQEGRS